METGLDPELAQLLPKLPLRDSRTLTPSIAREQLIALAQSRSNVVLPQPASVADVSIPGPAGPLRARLYRPARMPASTIVYFHGGGWVAGDLDTHDRQARLLAIEVEAVVLSVDYRRPPETKFPGAFDDGLAATQWAAAHITKLGGDAGRLGVAGDSAGATRTWPNPEEPRLIHGFFGMGNASAAAAEAGQRIRAAFKAMLEQGR